MKKIIRALVAGFVIFFLFFTIAYNIIELPDSSILSIEGTVMKPANRTLASMSISVVIIAIIVLITGIFKYAEKIKKKESVRKNTVKFIIFLFIILLLIIFSIYFFSISSVNRFI
ncbi:MAG: hypothetical protein RSB67_04085 [Clostridia bacterium]